MHGVDDMNEPGLLCSLFGVRRQVGLWPLAVATIRNSGSSSDQHLGSSETLLVVWFFP